MKRYLVVIMLLAVAFSGCNRGKINNLEQANKELTQELKSRDSVMNDYLQSMRQIEDNLMEIKRRENLINIQAEDENVQSDKSIQQKIIDDVKSINKLLKENREKVSGLNKKLDRSGYRVSELNKLVANLKEKISAKEDEIKAMKEKLVSLNMENESLYAMVDSLNFENEVKSTTIENQKETIEQQTQNIHQAYYAVGSYKNLEQKNILKKEGGILGIGAVEKLKDNFNQEAFTKVDIREITEIPVKSRKVEFVTAHPEESYEIVKNDEKGIERILINDAGAFWNSSKYLVLVTK